MTRYAIGVDLGGTRIKAVSVSETGEVLDRAVEDTRDDAANAKVWVTVIQGIAARFAAERGKAPVAIGLGTPGLPTRDGRSVAFMQGRLPGLHGLDWAEALASPVRILNDAQAALVGESWMGAAAGCTDVVLLTLGTGVGGAIVSGGRLLRGVIGRAGHFGHVSLDADGPPSITGIPGSLEGAIGNYTVSARSEGRFQDTRALVEAHLAGDALASRVWMRSVYVLACGIASIINAVDPERVVLGGGIVHAGPALFDPLAGFLDQVEWRPLGQRVQVVPALLGDLAGAIGAAKAALGGAGS